MVAGSSDRGSQLLVEAIREWGGPAQASIAIFGNMVPANLAALANGTMARALEIADVYDGFPLHPSSSIVPVALAIAERQGGITGKDLIHAVAIGHDMLIRMALATKVGPIQSGRVTTYLKYFRPRESPAYCSDWTSSNWQTPWASLSPRWSLMAKVPWMER
jgi:2-methylcitrate dehydratase PrpD